MDRYLKGIKHSQRNILLEIYNNKYPPIRNFVLQNKGDIFDSEDVFQDVMVSLYRRLQKTDIDITASFNTYIFSVGKFIWLKKLKSKSICKPLSNEFDIAQIENDFIEEEKYKIMRNKIHDLSEDCQKVLSMYFEKKNFDTIADAMSYKSSQFARRKKYLCKNKLACLIMEDPGYQHIVA